MKGDRELFCDRKPARGQHVAAAVCIHLDRRGVHEHAQGPCGIIGVICIRPDCMLQFLVSVVIAIVCTFVITLAFAKTIGRKQLATL